MSKTRKILLLPGDGIGPEVIAEVKKILEWMNKTNDHALVSFKPDDSMAMESYVQSKQIESDTRRKKKRSANTKSKASS